MKTRFLIVIIAFLGCILSASAQSNELNVEQVQKAIVGRWKVISLVRAGESTIDFSKENYIWEFTKNGGVKINCGELGQFSDKTRIIKSRIIRGAILIMIPKLSEHGFVHGKFIVRKISDDGKTILLGDWDDSLLYTIKKTE